MKKLFLSALIILLTSYMVSSQTVLSRRLYLGQLPPGNIPERFELSVNPGSFAAESNIESTTFGLGRPLNTEWDTLDFYIAKDESFIIAATITGLAISYPKPNGDWTSPRNLGEKINFGLASWGPFVTADHKYLFYTTGTKPDYSDTGIFWVRIDNLIDSLKNTNNVPYLKERLENRAAVLNQRVDFIIPEDAFLDDDGETTFSYSAILNTGQPLPGWLTFDRLTGRFYGSPSEPAEYTVIVTAADKEDAKGFGLFKLTIRDE